MAGVSLSESERGRGIVIVWVGVSVCELRKGQASQRERGAARRWA